MEMSDDIDNLNQLATIEDQAELAGLAEKLLDHYSDTQTYIHYNHDYLAKVGGEVIGIVRLQGGFNAAREEDPVGQIVFGGPDLNSDDEDKFLRIRYLNDGDPTIHSTDGSRTLNPDSLDRAYSLATNIQDKQELLVAEDRLLMEAVRLITAKRFNISTGYQSKIKLKEYDEPQTLNQLINVVIRSYSDNLIKSRSILSYLPNDETDIYIGTYEPSDPLDVERPYLEIERELSDGSKLQYKFGYEGNFARHVTVGEAEDEFEYEEPTVWQTLLVREAIEAKLEEIGANEPEQIGEAPFRNAVKQLRDVYLKAHKIPERHNRKKAAAMKEFTRLADLFEKEFYSQYHLVPTEKNNEPIELNLWLAASRDGFHPKTFFGQFNKLMVNSPVYYVRTADGLSPRQLDGDSSIPIEFSGMGPAIIGENADGSPMCDIYLTGTALADGKPTGVWFPMSTMTVTNSSQLLN